MRWGLNKRIKSSLILLISVMFIFLNTLTTNGKTSGQTKTVDKRPTTNTFISLGGSYSNNYILKKYGVYSSKDIMGSHIVGPIIAQDSVFKLEGNSIQTGTEWSYNTPSYVGSIIPSDPSITARPPLKLTHLYTFNNGLVPALYTKEDTINIYQENGLYKLYKDNKENSFLGPNNDGKGAIYQNNNFINFTNAKMTLIADSKLLADIPSIDVPNNNGYNLDNGVLVLDVGKSYIIKEASNITQITLKFPNGYDPYDRQYPYPTIINIVDNELKKSTYINPSGSNEEYQVFPTIGVDYTNPVGTRIIGLFNSAPPWRNSDILKIYKGDDLNIIWNLPNIKTEDGSLKVISAINQGAEMLGHIIAPNAEFYNYKYDGVKLSFAGGNINGAPIVGDWKGGGMEVHFWPFANDMLRIGGKKTYIGKSLQENKFIFKVESTDSSGNPIPTPDGIIKRNGIENATPETVGNKSDGSIAFSPILFKESGTYYFHIKELVPPDVPNPGDKITFDKSEYKLIATVTKNPILIGYDVSYKIFKIKDSLGNTLSQPSEVNNIEFENQYDYTLPSTGGEGDNKYLIFGGILMLTSILAYVWKKI